MALPESKASIINRVFTEKDEVALLRSMINFKSKKGHDPVHNLSAFKDFVNPSLSFSATKKQVSDKIRRLKKKYLNTILRRGQNPYFSRDHEDKLFWLSKKVWASGGHGDEDDSGSNVKSGDNDVCMQSTGNKSGNEKESEKSGNEKDNVEDCLLVYPFLCASLESEVRKASTLQRSSKEYLKIVIRGIDKEKASELEKEWEGFFQMEQQSYVKRTELIRIQSEALVDVICSSAAK